MSVPPRVPPYFDAMIEGFRRGEAGRQVHLGHWDLSGAPPPGDSRQEFAAAQRRLDAQMLALADLHDGQQVLDVGCGLGGTLEMIGRDRHRMHLVGVNIDPRQLDICRSVAPVNNNRLDWREADACRLPFADGSFDRVLCVEAMFHFASRRAFFAEAARVLRPGGVLAASDIVARSSARALDPGPQVEEAVLAGFGPWPDLWGSDADHRQLGAAAGLHCASLIDATANTAPSHHYTAPRDLDAHSYRGGDTTVRAALALRWLHAEGHLRYFYMRFNKPA